jgi:hypothetical protein
MGGVKGSSIGGTCFSQIRATASKESFKGMATDLLVIVPVLEQMAASVIQPTGQLTSELESFFLMCDIIRLLQRLKRQTPVSIADARHLEQLQIRHWQKFIEVYGEDNVKPKHHYALHIPQQAIDFSFLIDCWVLERKHRAQKRAANNVCWDSVWEESVNARILLESLDEQNTSPFSDRLLGATAVAPQLASDIAAQHVVVANNAFFRGMRIVHGDILFIENHAGQVAACMLVDGHLQLLVNIFVHAPAMQHGRGRRWMPQNGIAAIDLRTALLVQAECWYFEHDGSLITMGE